MPSTRRKPRDPVEHQVPAPRVRSPKVVQLAGKRASRQPNSGEDIVRSFATAVATELRAKHAAGHPYSTLNTCGDVVFVHPDGTVRVGPSADSALAH
jgi:hypothetical protein